MHVALIEPPKYVSLTNFVSTIAMPPIGPAYVAAALEEAGRRVTVVDAMGSALDRYWDFRGIRVRGLDIPTIVARIPADTDVICVGCMFSAHWPLVRMILRALRQRFPDTPLVLGGEHGTGMPQPSMAQAPLDAIVMGEGEETIVELAAALETRQPLSEVAGIAWRDNGEIRVNAPRERIRDIDRIARPAWHHFDIEAYHSVNQPHGAAQGRFMPMLATRGCPFKCTFCTSPNMWTQRWIARDAKLVVDEMADYVERYGASDFQFEDLTAIVRRDWILAFCDEILSRGLEVTFQLPSGTRSEAVDREVATKMKAAGCHEFAFAPESGDPRILKAIKKQVKLESMYASAKAAMDAGINVGCFFIIGFPEDDWKSILRTYREIVHCALLGFTNVNLNAYSPQPNTESFRQLVRDGVIPELDDDYLMSLFTFQDFGAKKKSYNSKFGDLELSTLVAFGAFVFYIFYFARKPQRVLSLGADLFRRKSENKTSKVARSALRDAYRIVRARLMP